MPVATPVDTMPPQCDVRPFTAQLFVDANRTAKVKLPPNATLRRCGAADGAQIITAPDNGGTEACVIYEYSVDHKITDIVIRPQHRTGVAASLKDKSCPKVDFSRQGYPGKDWFFMADNLPLANAYKVKEVVEKEGLAFMNREKAQLADRAAINYGSTPLMVEAIAPTEQVECRRTAGFFEGRYAACYRAKVYNQTLRGNWWLIVGLTKDNEYKVLQSTRTPAPVIVRRKLR